MEGSIDDTDRESLMLRFTAATGCSSTEAIKYLEEHNWVFRDSISAYLDTTSSVTSSNSAIMGDDSSDSSGGEASLESFSQLKLDITNEFMKVTGIDKEKATKYLSNYAWKLEDALCAYLEDVSQCISSDSDVEIIEDSPQEEPKETTKLPSTSRNNRIMTLDQLNQAGNENNDGLAYYAGGSEHSGQQILGPGKRKRTSERQQSGGKESGCELAHALKQAAKSQFQEPSGSRSPQCFRGQGYRLGESTHNSNGNNTTLPASIDLTSDDTTAIHVSDQDNDDNRDIQFVLYEDGFTLDGGPLKSYTDPDCAELVSTIRNGEFPSSLIQDYTRGTIRLRVMDKRRLKYDSHKKSIKAFSGKGHVLGSPSPSVSQTSVASEHEGLECRQTSYNFCEDENEKATLKIRLPDGTSLELTVNKSDKISNIRAYVNLARPQYMNSELVFITSFPRVELHDDDSILERNLLNSMIISKLL